MFLLPQQLGGPATYVVVAGESMQPSLHPGDLVVAREADSYGVGDVVVFSAPEGRVVHRIVGGSAHDGFVVQGDNKANADRWRPTADDVLGRAWLRIPSGGRALLAIRSPLILAVLSGLLAFLAVLADDESTEARQRKQRHPPLPASGRES